MRSRGIYLLSVRRKYRIRRIYMLGVGALLATAGLNLLVE